MHPETISSYRILGELGRGAMGIVYHAQDPGIGRPVAIKVIRVETGTTADQGVQLRQRLIREASAAGKLSHPGIVTIYQLGQEGQDIFVVMEYVPGNSLEHILAHETIDLPRALAILRQIAEALDYAHQAGIVHRDIKPANILVRPDGCVKITDFGIAKMTQAAAQTTTLGMTTIGSTVGSPAYMSPEQVRAEQVDGHSDQFSFGIVAYQMVTGKRPFSGDTVSAVMYQIVNADPFATPADAPLPSGSSAALKRALAKSPKDRFPNCVAFIDDLARERDGRTTASQAATVKLPAPVAPPKRRPVLLPAALALLIGLATGGYWLFRSSHGGGSSAFSTGSSASVPVEPPLIKAITEGRLEDARRLIANGIDVNASNRDGTTALMQAAEGSAFLPNNSPAVTMLLEKNAQVDAQDGRGRTALYRATAEGKQEAMRLLLARKANPNQPANDGSTPLLAAITFGHTSAMKLLLDSGAQIDLADAQGTTPLMLAAEGTAFIPNNAPLVETLLNKNAQIDAQDARGRSALYRAAAEGKTDAMRLLLDHKADVNLKANDGSTPLLQAVTFGKLAAVQLLLERGALVDLADASGNTPLMVAAEGTAFLPNNAPLVTTLLTSKAKVDAQDARGRSPLYRAAAEGKEDAMRILLEHKANPNLKANDGSTPLIATVTFGKLGAATLLLDRGANVNLADAGGNTPLMIAAEGTPFISSPAPMIAVLLSHGAKPDFTDARGRTALARANESKNAVAIDLLKSK
jgi:serine/threonine protein kinase